MASFTEQTYRRRMDKAVLVYVVCMSTPWLWLSTASGPVSKVLLALLPAAAAWYLIGLMMRRVRDSDELAQRVHLVAVGVATMVVSVLSLGAGFLAAAGMLAFDGSVLIWVFPVMAASYGVAHGWAGWRYGLGVDGDAVAMRVSVMANLLVVTGLFTFRERVQAHDGRVIGALLGIVLVAVAVHVLARRQRQRRDAAP